MKKLEYLEARLERFETNGASQKNIDILTEKINTLKAKSNGGQ